MLNNTEEVQPDGTQVMGGGGWQWRGLVTATTARLELSTVAVRTTRSTRSGFASELKLNLFEFPIGSQQIVYISVYISVFERTRTLQAAWQGWLQTCNQEQSVALSAVSLPQEATRARLRTVDRNPAGRSERVSEDV